MLSQYDFSTGTRLVICGFTKLICATSITMLASKQLALSVSRDFLKNMIPASAADQPM